MACVQAERAKEQSHGNPGGMCNWLKHSEEEQHKQQHGHVANGTHSPEREKRGHGGFFQSIKTKCMTQIEKMKKEFKDHDDSSSSSDGDDDRATIYINVEKKGVKEGKKGHQCET